MAAVAQLAIELARPRQRDERIADERELGVTDALARAAHDRPERARRDREALRARADRELARAVVHDAELPARERAAVALLEHRQQHALVALPVDVEEVRVVARVTVLEQSRHQRLSAPAIDMWFGTMSSKMPSPAARGSATSVAKPSSPPSCADAWSGSTTS